MDEMIMAFRNFLASPSNGYYTPDEIEKMISDVRHWFRFARSKNIRYFNVPSAFDIETSSFYIGKEKRACMYVWAFGLFGTVMIGRTWDEFVYVLDTIARVLDLNLEKRLIIYCHNFAYEFQWVRKWLIWDHVFALASRKPIYATTASGIEFRCSYLLTGYSLETTAKNLKMFDVKKMIGDLDYSLIRHSGTPLTEKEIGYSVNDVKVVMADIMERIVNDGNIAKIPLTKTGYVRQYCRRRCYGETV